MQLFNIDFITFTVYDIIDIMIVASIIYLFIIWLKGTRSVQMLFAIFLMVLIYVIAELWHLNGLKWIISNIKTIGILAFFIVFQPEIRRALTKLGQIGMSDIFFKKKRELIPVDVIVEGTIELSKNNLGGLIIIEKKVGLRTYLESGKQINAQATPELINTIFSKNTPLHDGAVIIRENKIAAAACVLPLLQNPGLQERQYGMRHRAGLGITAETDAVAIIVSEETGEISIAYGNDFMAGLSKKELKNKIEFYLEQ